MLVSIIITTYNRADKIADAIKSARAQTYPHKQIIVIDDGSTDETREIVEQFPDVEYFYQKNQKQAAARTSGLKLASGEFIATLDSDDVWNEDFLSQSVECLEKHRLDFVFSSWTTKKRDGIFTGAWEVSKMWNSYVSQPSGNWFLLSSKQVRELFIKTCPAPSSSLLIRKDSIVSEWCSDLIIADDWSFILDMILENPCRAAFTLQRLWTKGVQGENVYDGRNRGEIARELEIYDTRVMKKRYASKLTSKEMTILNRRILRGYVVRALFYARDNLGIRNPQRLWRSALELENKIKSGK